MGRAIKPYNVRPQ